jgi:hypothetical protein
MKVVSIERTQRQRSLVELVAQSSEHCRIFRIIPL